MNPFGQIKVRLTEDLRAKTHDGPVPFLTAPLFQLDELS